MVAVPVGTDSGDVYGRIISGFVLTVLQNEEMPAEQISNFERDLAPDGLKALGEADISRIVDFGKAQSMDFILICAYEAGRNEITFYTHMIDVSENALTVSVEEHAKPMLRMDGAIDRSLGRIIAAVESRFILAQGEEPEPLEEETTQAPPDTVEPQVVSVTRDPPREPTKQIRESGLCFSVGVGGLGALGKAADYFQIGIMPLMQLEYGFTTAIGQLILGGLIGTSYFEASGAKQKAQTLVAPAGLKLGYMSSGGGFLDITVWVSGGGTALAMNPEQKGYVVNIVPYGMGGFGLVALPAQAISIMLDVSVMVLFDKELIIGYVPALYISFH